MKVKCKTKFTNADDIYPNLITIELAITVKRILLYDVCNACQRTEDVGTQKFAEPIWFNQPKIGGCLLFYKYTH